MANRQARLQELMISRLAVKHERRLRSTIGKAMAKAARNLSDPLMLESLEHEHRIAVEKNLQNLWKDSVDSMYSFLFEEEQVKQVRAGFAPTVTANAVAGDFLRQYGAQKITQVAHTTIGDIKRVIRQGIDEGWSEKETATQLLSVAPTKSASRAQTIARTETHSAAQFAAQQTAELAEIPMMKQWIASGTESTRDTHAEADGQIVGLNEAFSVGADSLMYPGDPAGSPEETINCRCVVAYILQDDIQPQIPLVDQMPADEQVPAFDSGAGDEVNKLWAGSPEMTRMAGAIGEVPTEIVVGNKGVYLPFKKSLHTRANSATFTHEYGHFIDFVANGKINGDSTVPLSFSRNLHTALIADAKKAKLLGTVGERQAAATAFKQKYFTVEQTQLRGRPALRNIPKTEYARNLSDIYDAATGGRFYTDYGLPGHGKSYYKRTRADLVATETFANMTTVYGKPEWDEVKSVFPTAAARFEEIAKEIEGLK
jgi:hypothetical protein